MAAHIATVHRVVGDTVVVVGHMVAVHRAAADRTAVVVDHIVRYMRVVRVENTDLPPLHSLFVPWMCLYLLPWESRIRHRI